MVVGGDWLWLVVAVEVAVAVVRHFYIQLENIEYADMALQVQIRCCWVSISLPVLHYLMILTMVCVLKNKRAIMIIRFDLRVLTIMTTIACLTQGGVVEPIKSVGRGVTMNITVRKVPCQSSKRICALLQTCAI